MKVLPRHGQEENLNLQEDKAAKACNRLRWLDQESFAAHRSPADGSPGRQPGNSQRKPARLVRAPAASRSATAIGSRTATSTSVSSRTGRSRCFIEIGVRHAPESAADDKVATVRRHRMLHDTL
jgi:hypothetical protein